MKPLLLMAYDDNRRIVGNIASDHARQSANRYGFDFMLIQASEFSDPMMAQVASVCWQLQIGREFIVYSDADVVVDDLDFPKYSGVNFSQDSNGLCAGFFSVKRSEESIRLFECWNLLGFCDDCEREYAQKTMKFMASNFYWVRNQISYFSSSQVSCPEDKEVGQVAHHFWANCRPEEETAAMMLELIKKNSQ